MALEDIVNVTITTDTVGVSQAGFGVPLILSGTAAWAERIRFYTSSAAVLVDFPAVALKNKPEYSMAVKMFSQNPKPRKIAIGRGPAPTQRWLIRIPGVINNTAYKVLVDGETATYTSDGTALLAEVNAGIAAAINALSALVTASVVGNDVQVVADVAGSWFDLRLDASMLGATAMLEIEQNHADPGLAAALTAIKVEDNSWYGVVYPYCSTACVLAIAGWIQAEKKIFGYMTQESRTINETSGADSTSIARQLKTAAYSRTWGMYKRSPSDFADAALFGRCLPTAPGSETWALKTLAGVPVDTLTDTQENNAHAKDLNTYQTTAGVNITLPGKVAANEYIDVIRFIDWVVATMAERIFAKLVAAQKVPFDDSGIAVVENEIRGTIKDGIKAGGFTSDVAFVIQVPKSVDVSAGNKALRKLPDVKWSATLAGAIHSVDPVTGVVSV